MMAPRSAIRRFLGILLLLSSTRAFSADWPMFAHDPMRTGWMVEETTLSRLNVSQLTLKWKTHVSNQAKFLTALTAPVVASDVDTAAGRKTLVYVAGSSNNFHALDAATGALVWTRNFESR